MLPLRFDVLEDGAAAKGRELEQDDVEALTWGMTALAKQTTSAIDYARAIRTLHTTGNLKQ